MCMPGDNVEMTIELIHPIAMEQGLTFAIREGGGTLYYYIIFYRYYLHKIH